MINRQEMEVQTRGPDVGNPPPRRQGRGAGAPALLRRDAKRRGAREGRSGGSHRCVTVQAKAKCRRAAASGKPARSGKARFTSEMQVWWHQDGHEVCWSYPPEQPRLAPEQGKPSPELCDPLPTHKVPQSDAAASQSQISGSDPAACSQVTSPTAPDTVVICSQPDVRRRPLRLNASNPIRRTLFAGCLQLGRAHADLVDLVRAGYEVCPGDAMDAATLTARAILRGARDRSRDPHLRPLFDHQRRTQPLSSPRPARNRSKPASKSKRKVAGVGDSNNLARKTAA
jgi:hypothetical protein